MTKESTIIREAKFYLEHYVTAGDLPDQVERNNYSLGIVAEWFAEYKDPHQTLISFIENKMSIIEKRYYRDSGWVCGYAQCRCETFEVVLEFLRGKRNA